MTYKPVKLLTVRLLSLIGVSFLALGIVSASASPLPDASLDTTLTKSPDQKIVLAGGCFWGMQAVFQHVKGVHDVVSGYAGGNADKAHYEMVSTGETGHAESVEVTYDPSQIKLDQILKIYFSVAHDPTELNRQGHDTGTQYRSEIFATTDEQKKVADAYIAELNGAKSFSSPIVTKVEPLKAFYPAEAYHQNYAKLHPYNPYIAINDLPKVSALKDTFPDLYVDTE